MSADELSQIEHEQASGSSVSQDSTQDSQYSQASASSSEVILNSAAGHSRKKTRYMSEYLNRMNKDQINKSRPKFAMSLYTGHVPFLFVENYFIREMFDDLGLSGVPPSRRELSTSLLDQAGCFRL